MTDSIDRGAFIPHVPCRCERCADRYGDQASTRDEALIDELRARLSEGAELVEALVIELAHSRRELEQARRDLQEQFTKGSQQ